MMTMHKVLVVLIYPDQNPVTLLRQLKNLRQVRVFKINFH